MAARKTRARSNTERGRAARYRATLRRGGRLGWEARRWLERYERGVTNHAAARRAAIKPRPKGSPRKDARRVAKAVADWLGAPSGPGRDKAHRTPRPGSPGAMEHIIPVSVRPRRDADGVMELSRLELPEGSGRAVNIRLQLIGADGEPQWISVGALNDDWDDLASEMYDAVDEAMDAYAAEGIAAVSVYSR